MAIVAKIGRMVGHEVGKKYFGKGHSLKAKIGRGIARNIGSTAARMIPVIGSFRKGGHVKKTGAYILHKGERVIPAKK